LLGLSYYLNAKGYLKNEEPEEPETQTPIKTPKAVIPNNPIINEKIKDIDISNIDGMVFKVNAGQTFEIKAKNMLKIGKMIVDKFGKTFFEANELK
jgi:hypothetical protein